METEVAFLDENGRDIEPILGENDELSIGFQPEQDDTMSIDELNIEETDPNDSYGNTTSESMGLSDISMSMSDISNASGGRRKKRATRRRRIHRRAKRRTFRKKRVSSVKRHTRRRKRLHKRTVKRRLRGGACYGNGVGANAYDPNYSVYNTRSLQLFPYKP